MYKYGDRSDNSKTDLRTLTLTLTVSLFMAMLAFFMILNSYASSSKNKMAKVQDSISDQFGLIGQGRATQDSGSKGSGTAGDMEAAAAASLRSVLPDVGFQSHNTSTGHVMSVTVPRAELDERWPAIRSRLADLLINMNPGGRYRLQILSVGDGVTEADLASRAAVLEDDGVNAKLLSVGYESHGQDAIELRFISGGG